MSDYAKCWPEPSDVISDSVFAEAHYDMGTRVACD